MGHFPGQIAYYKGTVPENPGRMVTLFKYETLQEFLCEIILIIFDPTILGHSHFHMEQEPGQTVDMLLMQYKNLHFNIFTGQV